MKVDVFRALVEETLRDCVDIMLGAKDREYSRSGDKLHNFKVAGRYDNESPERALWGMWKKHIVSIHDIINDVDAGKGVDVAVLDEKIRDMINYTLLLKGLLYERLGIVVKAKGKPKIVCLCGSVRYKDALDNVALKEALAGNIVLTVECGSPVKKVKGEAKKRIDELQLRKIEMADEIVVVNVDGYIGESTKKEIQYAVKLGKKVRYIVEDDV